MYVKININTDMEMIDSGTGWTFILCSVNVIGS